MMRVKPHLGAGRATAALDPELEGPVAADAELVLALDQDNKRTALS